MDLLRWYEGNAFPAYVPAAVDAGETGLTKDFSAANIASLQVVPGSHLCHASLSRWCAVNNVNARDGDKRARCARAGHRRRRWQGSRYAERLFANDDVHRGRARLDLGGVRPMSSLIEYDSAGVCRHGVLIVSLRQAHGPSVSGPKPNQPLSNAT